MSAKQKPTAANEAEKNENPLISNRMVRQIYTKLLEVRAFDERSAKSQPRTKAAPRLPSARSEEAARVSALIVLKPGDLISDASIHPANELVLGTEPRYLLKQSSTRRPSAQTEKAKQLPPIADAKERLQLAMGAALALKNTRRESKPGNIVVAFVASRELDGNAWKKVLTLAGQLELPIIFIALPGASKKNASLATVSHKARLARVPGIPVDSSDAIALFRVMQESLGRTRGGDGPVVIECLEYKLAGQLLSERDPIVQMRQFILERKISNRAELNAIHKTSQRKLRALQH